MPDNDKCKTPCNAVLLAEKDITGRLETIVVHGRYTYKLSIATLSILSALALLIAGDWWTMRHSDKQTGIAAHSTPATVVMKLPPHDFASLSQIRP